MTAPELAWLLDSLPPHVVCPRCHGQLTLLAGRLRCSACGDEYEQEAEIPLLFTSTAADDVAAVKDLYDHVAHEYDAVFAGHVTRHYLDKRLETVERLLPGGGHLLDVGCGTGALAAHLMSRGYTVSGVDVSPGMLSRAVARGLAAAVAGFSSALPFASDTFDLALTVATFHHLDTPLRVALTVLEMARVVRPGGYVLIWDHNPLNPYWPVLMKRVPQDTGDERLVPLGEIVADAKAAGLRILSAQRLGLIPDFVPLRLMPIAEAIERLVEATPLVRSLAAHNVVIARKA
ncbi:MAG: methyltransferase domain-containing protein [Chloroflexi bacterium]|nr:methyltransferase domain-containing protein [Chloroflexota bacterium]